MKTWKLFWLVVFLVFLGVVGSFYVFVRTYNPTSKSFSRKYVYKLFNNFGSVDMVGKLVPNWDFVYGYFVYDAFSNEKKFVNIKPKQTDDLTYLPSFHTDLFNITGEVSADNSNNVELERKGKKYLIELRPYTKYYVVDPGATDLKVINSSRDKTLFVGGGSVTVLAYFDQRQNKYVALSIGKSSR